MTPFPRAPFLLLVATVVGVPPAYVTWRGSPEPSYLRPGAGLAWASLRVGTISRVAVGADDIRKIDNGDGTFTVNTVGRRQIVIGIDCFTWDSTLVHTADELLEQLITRIYLPVNLDALNGMALVVETNEKIVEFPTTINSRYISGAHCDLTVALANQDLQSAAYPGGDQWVGEVKGTMTVDGNVGGTIDVIAR